MKVLQIIVIPPNLDSAVVFVALTLLLRDPSPSVRAATAAAISMLCDY